MNYTITKDNIHIEDSYKVRKKEMQTILQSIKNPNPNKLELNVGKQRAIYIGNHNSDVWKRTFFSLKMEWAVHNALYALGLFRSHTKDVDLNCPNKIAWLYNIIGVLVWPFIK